MKKDILISELRRSETWTEDRYGNFKTPDGTTRLKIQATSVRLERKGLDGTWFNRVSDYYKNVSIYVPEWSISGKPALCIKGKLFVI